MTMKSAIKSMEKNLVERVKTCPEEVTSTTSEEKGGKKVGQKKRTFEDMLPLSTAVERVLKRPTVVRFKDEPLDLECEWNVDMCEFHAKNMDEFMHHVSSHITCVPIKQNDTGQEVYACGWDDCSAYIETSGEIVRHIFFHAYHTKLKSVAKNVLERTKLEPCMYENYARNLIPDLPESFKCLWQECGTTFENPQRFYSHMNSHLWECTDNSGNKNIKCLWDGCVYGFHTYHKLREHLRSHTQEKMLACPTCGGLFSSRTKFYDHCQRQLPVTQKTFQCTHCSKSFPTERILKDHIRTHVNHYKCPHCDMTCPAPSSLASHIKYRHSQSKPYICPYCPYRTKTRYDLSQHVPRHSRDYAFCCDIGDCTFKVRTQLALQTHVRKVHEDSYKPLYCCHICNMKLLRGTYLTKHLTKVHNFRWPSGHSRFRYRCEEDGYFRLQTVRYESLEVTEEFFQELQESSEDVDDPDIDPLQSDGNLDDSQILVSVEEVDETGKIVRSQTLPIDQVSLPVADEMTVFSEEG